MSFGPLASSASGEAGVILPYRPEPEPEPVTVAVTENTQVVRERKRSASTSRGSTCIRPSWSSSYRWILGGRAGSKAMLHCTEGVASFFATGHLALRGQPSRQGTLRFGNDNDNGLGLMRPTSRPRQRLQEVASSSCGQLSAPWPVSSSLALEPARRILTRQHRLNNAAPGQKISTPRGSRESTPPSGHQRLTGFPRAGGWGVEGGMSHERPSGPPTTEVREPAVGWRWSRGTVIRTLESEGPGRETTRPRSGPGPFRLSSSNASALRPRVFDGGDRNPREPQTKKGGPKAPREFKASKARRKDARRGGSSADPANGWRC
jgi:hypothetical protein